MFSAEEKQETFEERMVVRKRPQINTKTRKGKGGYCGCKIEGLLAPLMAGTERRGRMSGRDKKSEGGEEQVKNTTEIYLLIVVIDRSFAVKGPAWWSLCSASAKQRRN